MPVACYSECETAWQTWEQPVVAVCGVVPVAAILPVVGLGIVAATSATSEVVCSAVFAQGLRLTGTYVAQRVVFHY